MPKNIFNIVAIIGVVVFILCLFFSASSMVLMETINPLIFAILFTLIFFVSFVAFIIAFVAIILADRKEQEMRRQDLQNLAQTKGWTYYPTPKQMNFLIEIKRKLGISSLATHPLEAKTQNLLTGKAKNSDIAIFDQVYHIGTGKNRKRIEVTFFVFMIKNANFPVFCCESEDFWNKVSDMFSKHDIDFHNYPLFSKKYLLYGRNELAIRQLFRGDVLLEYQNSTEFTTIGVGKYLIFYEPNFQCPPEEIGKQLQKYENITKMFLGKSF